MSLVITPTYTWSDGDVVTATRLNSTPTIADGQAGVFSTISASGAITVSNNGQAVAIIPNTGTREGYILVQNSGGTTFWGMDNATATSFNTAGNYGTVIYRPAATGFAISRTSTIDLAISSAGAITMPSGGGLGITGTISITSDATIGGILTYSGGLKYVVSDFNKAASTTFSDVSGLSVNVINGGVYRFVVTSALSQAGAGGYKVGLGGTATLSAGGSVYQYLTSTVANSIQGNLGIGGFSTAAINAAQSAAFLWHGTFTASSTGTVTVQFAQNSAASISTFGAGSYFEVVRVS